MGANEVIISRSIKRSGAPTVPSRFLQRIRAVAGESLFSSLLKRGADLISYAREIDKSNIIEPLRQPRPVPNSALLPRKLSITEIETLRRDPYSIYAKHVLKLDALDPIGKKIGPSDLGTMFHEAFARFAENWPIAQPENPLEKLLVIGKDAFVSVADQLRFQVFWWPRFEEAARWFIAWDAKRRINIAMPLAVERKGALAIALPRGGELILNGQADRIEMQPDNGFSVIDFKTGKMPTVLQVKAGFSPQLTIEAAMLKRGAFQELNGTRTNELLYVKLGGKNGGEERLIRETRQPFDPDELAEAHYSELVQLIDEHWNGRRPFLSRPYPEFLKDYARYDHLARVREWSLTGGVVEDGGEE
jgi:ATP-dependent helicase/nuclease subunit B